MLDKTGENQWDRALRIAQEAADLGFDWEHVFGVLDKIVEEVEEVRTVCEQLYGEKSRSDKGGSKGVFKEEYLKEVRLERAGLEAGGLKKAGLAKAVTCDDAITSAGVDECRKDEGNERTQQHPGSVALREEVGDLLFAVVNLCRFLDIDAGSTLALATHKFEHRWSKVQALVRAGGRSVEEVEAKILNQYWDQVKKEEADL